MEALKHTKEELLSRLDINCCKSMLLLCLLLRLLLMLLGVLSLFKGLGLAILLLRAVSFSCRFINSKLGSRGENMPSPLMLLNRREEEEEDEEGREESPGFGMALGVSP